MSGVTAVFLFMFSLYSSQAAAPMPTVKFTPAVKIYECPAIFKHKSECIVSEKKLEPVKLWLSIEVMSQVMGQWTHQETSPVPASFYVIVLKGSSGAGHEYSVSTETGITGSAMPFSNGRVEFHENSTPENFGISAAPIEKDGKKYIIELRISDFHGRSRLSKK